MQENFGADYLYPRFMCPVVSLRIVKLIPAICWESWSRPGVIGLKTAESLQFGESSLEIGEFSLKFG